nr:hypothetical protein [Tanacetum cinerariifolium]
MSTRSSARNLFPPLDNPELTIRRRSRTDPTLLNNSEMAAEGNGDLPVPDLRTMEELCQPSLNGRGGPIAPIAIQATNYLDKFLHVTQSIKVNGVTDDAIHLYLFPHSLTHHDTAWFDRLPRNSINSFEQMAKMFLAWERYKLSIDRFPNHNMLPVTQIDTFYNGLTLRHRDTINAAAGGTFMKRRSGTLPGNTITNQKEDLKGITTRSGTAYQGPTIPTTSLPLVVKRETEATKDTAHPINNGSTKDIQPPVVPTEFLILNSEPVISPIIELVASPFGPSIKSLLTNKDKLCELARTPLNEHYLAVLLTKFPEKLGDPDKFLIPCNFPGMAECLALADLDACINLMPLSIWNKLSLPDLSPTCMTLELADRLISRPVGVAEDVFVKVGTFYFLADFVVIDFDADPRVPLILERSFLKTGRALIDVFKGELTLRVGKEDITFNLDQTSRYSANYNKMTANRIDVIDMACEEYSDFLLEEVDAFLALEDDPTLPEVDHSYVDTEGDILLLEAFLNDDPSLPPPNQGNYQPEVHKELKICKPKIDKSSFDEPLEVELKDLPPHLEYAFLKGDDKLPVIIVKDLSVEEKTALIMVLKSHKRAITWKLSVIKGIDPEFCTHKMLMEEDFKPAVQHQRRVNPKIHDVIKLEVLKLLDAGLIYPISDSLVRTDSHSF